MTYKSKDSEGAYRQRGRVNVVALLRGKQAGKICARQCTGTQGEAVPRVGHSQGLLQ